MEGPFRLLLLAGLLAAVLPAAAPTFGTQPGAPCEPTVLASQVSLFCAHDMPTAQCCEPVVAAVDLGGGVPCLCRVAAEPQLVMAGLNATHLLTLYTSCGGLRPGGAHLAAACEGPAPPAAVVFAPPPSPAPRRKQPAHETPPPPPSTEKPSPPPQQHDGAAHSGQLARLLPAAAATFGPQPGAPCEPTLLATQVALFCAPDMPTAQCCEPVVAAVDHGGGVPCLCRVAGEPQLVMAGLNATHLLTLYTSCCGVRPGGAHLASACEDEAAPPPPSTEKPSPPPQQRDGAAHSKAFPAYAATSPLAPAATAISPAAQSSYQGIRSLRNCPSREMAGEVVTSCDSTEDTPTSVCCSIVITIVDESCLCLVSEEAEVRRSTHLGQTQILFLYKVCGGQKVISEGACDPLSAPPPPVVVSPPGPSASHLSTLSTVLVSVFGGLIGLAGIGGLVYTLVKWLQIRDRLVGGPQPGVNPRVAAGTAAEQRVRATTASRHA